MIEGTARLSDYQGKIGVQSKPVGIGKMFAHLARLPKVALSSGPGLRPEQYNRKLHRDIRSMPASCLLASVCTGSCVYGQMGLLDGVAATNRKNPDRPERLGLGKLPIDQLAEMAPTCRISRARIVDAGRFVMAGWAASRMELGVYLLCRAGLSQELVEEIAAMMKYETGYAAYKDDSEVSGPVVHAQVA